MTREEARQEIRSNWRQILSQITATAKKRVNGEASYICPKCGHGKNGDGLTINPRSKDGTGLKCFGCDFSGDVIALYQETTGKDYNAALTDLAEMLGITIDGTAGGGSSFNGKGNTTAPKAAKEPQNADSADYTAYYETCRYCLYSPEEGKAARDYLEKRKVLAAAVTYGAGFDPEADPVFAPGGNGKKKYPCPRIIIPCGKGHYVARSIDPNNENKKLNPTGSKVEIFNLEALYAQEVQEVFITEGIFDALSVLEVDGKAISINSTSIARTLIEKLEEKPTAATLIICLDNDGSGEKAKQILQEGFTRLKIPFISADICNGKKDPNEAIQADRDLFYDAVHDAITEARRYRLQLQQEAQREQEERQRRTGAGMIDSFLEAVRSRKYEPVPTGITDIDKAIGGGFIRQQLVLLGAAPGAGKTALAQWIFEGMAKRGISCLYLNLEMSREQMLARSISRIARQNGDTVRVTDILQGYKWTIEQEEAITIAAEQYRSDIAPRMIYNPDGVTADLDSILNYAEEEAQQAEAAGLPAPLVVVDYLQIITGRDREDDTTTIKRAVSSFKKYAIAHNTIVFLIMAHNREANKTGTVTQESGRDTSALEYSADLQLGLAYTRCLDRPGQEKKAKEQLTPEEMQYITLKVTKGRFTRPGTEVDLLFNGETMTYNQLENKRQEPEKLNLRRY